MSKNEQKVAKFIEQVRNGEITDFTPYLTMKPVTIQSVMAANDIMVDELVKQGNPVVLQEFVKNGKCQEHYSEWAKTARKDVRETLAYYGHCPDILIHDKDKNIRYLVFSRDPEYAKFCLNTKSTDEFFNLIEMFVGSMNPNYEHINQLRQNPLYAQFGIKSNNMHFSDKGCQQMRYDLETKVAAFEVSLSPMERTMSPYQLFASGSKRWPSMVNGRQRCVILTYEKELRTHECGEEWFERIVGELYNHYRIRRDIEDALGNTGDVRDLIKEID